MGLQAMQERGPPCARSAGTSPEPWMFSVLLGVQEPTEAGHAADTQVMGAVKQDTHQCCWCCQSPVVHKARAGLKPGHEAEDA